MSGGVSWWRRGQDDNQRTQKVQKSEKGERGAGRGELVWGDRPGGPSREKTVEEGQGWLGFRRKEGQKRRTEESPVPQLWWRPLLAGL